MQFAGVLSQAVLIPTVDEIPLSGARLSDASQAVRLREVRPRDLMDYEGGPSNAKELGL